MVHNLGMRINTNEARVLIASCDQNRNSFIDLDEFMDLLYNTDNVLNVDLQKIVKLKPGEKPIISEKRLESLLNNLQDDAIKAH